MDSNEEGIGICNRCQNHDYMSKLYQNFDKKLYHVGKCPNSSEMSHRYCDYCHTMAPMAGISIIANSGYGSHKIRIQCKQCIDGCPPTHGIGLCKRCDQHDYMSNLIRDCGLIDQLCHAGKCPKASEMTHRYCNECHLMAPVDGNAVMIKYYGYGHCSIEVRCAGCLVNRPLTEHEQESVDTDLKRHHEINSYVCFKCFRRFPTIDCTIVQPGPTVVYCKFCFDMSKLTNNDE